VEEIHSALKNGTSPQLEALNATEWFNLFTAKMDVLHEVSRMMIKQLSKADEPSQKPAKTNGKAPETSVPALSQSMRMQAGLSQVCVLIWIRSKRCRSLQGSIRPA
jgi:hypothetical protein